MTDPAARPSGPSEPLTPPSPGDLLQNLARRAVSSRTLIEELVRLDILTESTLMSLLGPDRHDAPISRIEAAILDSNMLSIDRLAEIKAGIAGREPIGNHEGVNAFPPEVAKAAGAIALKGPTPLIAMIEDSPENVERVAIAVQRRDFGIVMMTAQHFAQLYRAVYTNTPALTVRPATGTIFDLFDQCVEQDASDIHLSVGAPPVLRISGSLVPLPTQNIDQEWMKSQIVALMGEKALATVLKEFDLDGSYSYGPVRFRINAGADNKGLTLAIRRLPSKIPTFDDLGLPPAVRRFVELERGLVLVTGPTGSGKSTTLASLLSHIGLHQARHMLTLEDPIEFSLPSNKSMVHQRELHTSFTSFASGLRQSLRQDPDVVLVGEARDRETVGAAVTAAETGALVFTTLHTFDAASTLGRIIAMFSEGEQDQIRSQLAYVLRGVVSQSLVPAIAGGRVGAYEVLVSTPAVVNNLRKPDGLLSIKQTLSTGQPHGMQTMEAHLAALVKKGVVAEKEAEYKARDKDEFFSQLRSTGPDLL